MKLRRDVRDWVVKAEEDYETARLLVRKRKRKPNLSDGVCFHAQQCAEKYLKALMTSYDIVPPRTHDLVSLARFLRAKEPTIELVKDLCHALNPYAVENRYPGEQATRRQMKLACKAAKEIRRFIRARLKLSA
jgi:HEPN domain-containing protein